MIDLKKQVIVVTGGLGFIGQSFVRSIAQNNGVAIIADMEREDGEEIRQQLIKESRSEQIHFLPLDMNQKDSVQDFLETAGSRFGRIDALVNNAYYKNDRFWDPFFEVELEDFNENLTGNLGGYFLCSQQFALYFKKQGCGNVINISSIYGVIPPRFEIYEGTPMTMPVVYAAMKSALIHLTKYMAKYFKGMNIRVNAISPGGVLNQESERFQENYKKLCTTKGMLDIGDLQGALLFLLSNLSTYINGQNIVVDDGFVL